MEKRDLVVTRVYEVPVERVWKAWSEAEEVMKWWGPDCFTSPIAEMDFREGGKSVVCMRAPKEFGGMDMYSVWAYQKIEPMRTIDLVQNLSGKEGNVMDPVQLGMPPEFPMDMRTVARFKDLGDGRTEMTVTEYDWPICPMLKMAELGLNQCLDKMGRSLAQC
jgi:uncharacterized protein YndB with AHSA1/START domain